MAAFVYFWSSAYEVSGGCATDTLYPSFLSMLATGSQPEPSAKAPCTRTTFLIRCVITILLCGKGPFGSFDFDFERLRTNCSCLRAELDSHLAVRTCPLLVNMSGGGSLLNELGRFFRMR